MKETHLPNLAKVFNGSVKIAPLKISPWKLPPRKLTPRSLTPQETCPLWMFLPSSPLLTPTSPINKKEKLIN